jgi:hypothetical protein
MKRKSVEIDVERKDIVENENDRNENIVEGRKNR